jgi:hypothetical protein
MMSTWFSRAKVMTSRFPVCEQYPSGTKIKGNFFCRLCMFDEMKKPLGENLVLYPLRWMVRVD